MEKAAVPKGSVPGYLKHLKNIARELHKNVPEFTDLEHPVALIGQMDDVRTLRNLFPLHRAMEGYRPSATIIGEIQAQVPKTRIIIMHRLKDEHPHKTLQTVEKDITAMKVPKKANVVHVFYTGNPEHAPLIIPHGGGSLPDLIWKSLRLHWIEHWGPIFK